MTVTYIDRKKQKTKLSSTITSFVLPYSGKIVIKEIFDDYIYINGLSQSVSAGAYTIEIDDTSLEIEVDREMFVIRVLCGQYSDEMKLDYNEIGEMFHNNLIMNKLDWEVLEDAITMDSEDQEQDQLKLSLCTFNRKIESVTSNQNLREISKLANGLPHIFHKPKQHLKQINEIRPASVATRTGQESIRYLASHSEHWKGIRASGLVPDRLLVRSLEDDPAIYENVAVKTLTDKLYAQMKELSDQSMDCQMQISMDDTYTFGDEQKNFYHARNILLKGLDDDSVILRQALLEEQQGYIDHILERVSVCKGTPLYRKLKRERPVIGKLKNTNIFMMDKYYKQAYQLWGLLGTNEESSVYEGVQDVTYEYALFCRVLFVFALRFFNFRTQRDDVDLFEGTHFTDAIYSFAKWNVVFNDVSVEELDTDAFELKMFINEPIIINVPSYNITENCISGMKGVETEKDRIIVDHILDDSEQQELVGKCKALWPSGKQNKMANSLKAIIYQELSYVHPKEMKLLFVPWKHVLPDNTEEYTHLRNGLKDLISTDGYEQVYVLTVSRPNEFKEIKEGSTLNQMLTYGKANKSAGIKSEKVGFIPITLGDINSYRRYTRILLEAMIKLDDDHEICPICGEIMSKGSGQESNINTCLACGYKIIETQCSCCKKKYLFTRYSLPSTISVDEKEIQFRALTHENELGFKNITEASIENDQINPYCPYCGE